MGFAKYIPTSVLILLLLLTVFVGISRKTIAKNEETNSENVVTLSWEVPEEGTAVNYFSQKEYSTSVPILRSNNSMPMVIKTSIPVSPVLKRLILPGTEDKPSEENTIEDSENITGFRAAQKAIEFYEKKIHSVNVNGAVLNIATDCSYFVRAAYWEGSNHTLDLFAESISTHSIDPKIATGVTLISSYFKQKYRYQTRNPRIGDVIIFDNTYDKNQNQARDDYYTHTGIATGIRNDQTIEFIHGNIGRTIQRGYINFNFRNDSVKNQKQVNSFIRPRYSWDKDISASLASHLVRAFGGF